MDILRCIVEDLRLSARQELYISDVQCDELKVHVDSFLFTHDEIYDLLVPQMRTSLHRCKDCGSRNIETLDIISHSMSIAQLQFIFKHLLQNLKNQTLVDVGSRFGAVLYGAYVFSEADRIVGIEIDPEFCEIQKRVIEKYKMKNRIEVICDDVCNQMEILCSADVIVLNNVFEYFCSLQQQQKIWLFLREALQKSGSIIISSPSLTDCLIPLKIDISVTEWVKLIDTTDLMIAAVNQLSLETEDLSNIFCYKVF